MAKNVRGTRFSGTAPPLSAAIMPTGRSYLKAVFRELGPPKNLLPNKYRAPNTTDLKVTVEEDKPPEPLTLELKG